jgi:hypothetical protein
LQGTGWVDRQAGTAHIPIDRAIDLLAANPPPSRSAAEASQYQSAGSSSPSSARSGRMLSPVASPSPVVRQP